VTPEVFLVAAVAANGTIGADGTLPWHIPADLKRFKALTIGHPMVMGRKTFDSLPGLLPCRRHVVLTRDRRWQAEGAEVAHSFDEALAMADAAQVAVIGGAEIYALALAAATRLELTEVRAEVPGDTHMPPLGQGWRESFREEHGSEQGRPGFAWVTLLREL
jgi:dihydrofolate reductase